jgi:hypothetical protein
MTQPFDDLHPAQPQVEMEGAGGKDNGPEIGGGDLDGEG